MMRRTRLGTLADSRTSVKLAAGTTERGSGPENDSCSASWVMPAPSVAGLAGEGDGEVKRGAGGGGELKPYPCPYCSLSYKTTGWLTRHVKTAHGEVVVRPETHEARVPKKTLPPLFLLLMG